MYVIVPVKRFHRAKQRLAPVVTPQRRALLARAMAEHVLHELSRSSTICGAMLLSGEKTLAIRARRYGFDVKEDMDTGLNAALASAMESLPPALTSGDVAIVLADLPLFSAREFDRVARIHAREAGWKLTIVPDRQGLGTNLRIVRPGSVLPPLYGRRSCVRHMHAARRHGVAVELVQSDALGLDCDTPEDLVRLREHGWAESWLGDEGREAVA